MIADGVQPYPNELWAWGIKNRSGHLRVETDPEIMHTNLLPAGEASVTQNGLRFKKLHYTCESALLGGRFVRTGRKQPKVDVHYDPRCADTIYVRPRPGTRLEQCVLTDADRRFVGLDWREVKDHFESLGDEEAAEAGFAQQSKAELHANVKILTDNAVEETNAALKKRGQQSKRSRLGSISSNQRAERVVQRHAELGRSTPPEPEPGKIVEIGTGNHVTHPPAPAGHEDEDYISRPSRLNRLRAIRDSQRQQPPSAEDDKNHE